MQRGPTGFNDSKVRWRWHWCGRARCPTHVPANNELRWGFNVAAVAELTVPGAKDTFVHYRVLTPESSKHEASFSTCFDTSGHTDVSIIEMEEVSRKEVRWERVIVAAQQIASKVVRALIMFQTHAGCQYTICSPHLSMLAERRNISSICIWLRAFWQNQEIFSAFTHIWNLHSKQIQLCKARCFSF